MPALTWATISAAAPTWKEAATASTAAFASGNGAFKYNRANYMFDNALRFERYTSGYSMAIGQAGQYRDDIRDLTLLSTGKMDLLHMVGVIFWVIQIQLIMAGRLGVHGPAPPGWLLAIYWTQITTSTMFLCCQTWFSMHASARAQAGVVTMLTRSTRLPIPTPKQLDKARKTGNSFERSRMTDMFRIPFVAPAPDHTVQQDGGSDSDSSAKSKTSGTKPRSGKKHHTKNLASNRKLPRWHQEDEAQELYTGSGGAAPSLHHTPEHFELYRGAQQEWVFHEMYARIGALYFVSHWLTSASLYTMCHCFGELRALWPAWSCTLIFVTAHYGILKLDITGDLTHRQYNFPIEKVVPLTPIFCVLGMSLDYSVIKPTVGWQAFIYFLSWICYAIQMAWALRLYDLARPEKVLNDDGSAFETAEKAGQPWWPAEWEVSPAFSNMLCLVAPPRQLEPGQTCLQQEMKAAKGSKKGTITKKAKDVGHSNFAWKVFRGAIFTAIAMNVFMICGRTIEHINGERWFLKQEGRVERWPSHMQPWVTPWSRFGTRNEWGHTGGSDRRLSGAEGQKQSEISEVAQRLTSVLGPLADALDQPLSKAAIGPQPQLHRVAVEWPTQFQPKFLASGVSSGSVAALTNSRQGAIVNLQTSSHSPFNLEGTDGFGDVLGASLHDSGMLLAMKSGALAECADKPRDGVWRCQESSRRLPTGGAILVSAALGRVPGIGHLRVALTFEGDNTIALYDEDKHSGDWLPAGEVQMPFTADTAVPHMSMSSNADELLVSSTSGDILKWPFGGAEPEMIRMPQQLGKSRGVQQTSASHVAMNRVARLVGQELFVSNH